MEIIKAFNTNALHTEIVIKGTYDKPLFRASDIGLVLEMSNIRATINDFNETEKVVNSIDTLGGQQSVTFLTAKGLYKVLFKSRKPIAEKFQNWVCDIIEEIRLTGKYNLEKQLENAKNEIVKIEETNKNEINKKVSKEREQFLLREFGANGSIVYIIKVKSLENGQYIVKIGESRRGIQGRYSEHKSNYEEVLLLDCFSVKRCKDFENFIFSHEHIKFNRVTDLPGHENERELFLIGKSLSYKTLLHVINGNIKQFNDYDLEKLQAENELLKSLIASDAQSPPVDGVQSQPRPVNTRTENLIIQELLDGQKEMMKIIQNLEKSNKEILDKLNSSQTKTTTNFNQPLVTLGPKLQQINPENMTLNKVYESVAECLKEYNFKIKRPSIIKAINENTIYCGFRWAFVDRDKDSNIVAHMENTKVTRVQNVGYIAKLNKEKTEIMNVYLDRKTACSCNDYKSITALDNHVKNETLANGNYYVLFHKCTDELQNNFIEKNGEPLLYKDGIGQFSAQNEIIKEFSCKYDAIKNLKMSDKTLAKALDKNILYNNYYFKSIGSKLEML